MNIPFLNYALRGPGGSKVNFHLFVVSYLKENGSYQELFLELKNIVPKLLNFQIAKIHTITLCAQTLIAISEINFKIFSYSFCDKYFKLGSYVQGTKKNF